MVTVGWDTSNSVVLTKDDLVCTSCCVAETGCTCTRCSCWATDYAPCFIEVTFAGISWCPGLGGSVDPNITILLELTGTCAWTGSVSDGYGGTLSVGIFINSDASGCAVFGDGIGSYALRSSIEGAYGLFAFGLNYGAPTYQYLDCEEAGPFSNYYPAGTCASNAGSGGTCTIDWNP